MGQSERLRFTEVRDVFRLIGELCELGQDTEVWRSHMLKRLNELIDARASYVFQSRPPVVEQMSTVTSLVGEGFEGDSIEIVFDQLFNGGLKGNPIMPPMFEHFMRGEHFTVVRRQLVDDEPYYASESVQRFNRALGTDDFMSTQYFIIPPLTVQAINFHRDQGRRPFGAREQRVTQLFHTELGRLWDEKSLPKPDPCDGLSPRMRQIVAMLRTGLSEKEIAGKTKLSVHTVHDYVKRLYTHFGVSNRAGLLSATTPPPVPYRPALSP